MATIFSREGLARFVQDARERWYAVIDRVVPPRLHRMLGRTGTQALVIAAIWIALLFLWGPNSYEGYVLLLTGVYAIAVLGLNLMVGYSGVLSLGQGASFALGAYITAILSSHYGWPVWATLPAAILGGLLIGVLLGLPAGRLLAIGLAMVSLGSVLVFNDMLVLFADFTGGNYGVAAIYPAIGFDTGPLVLPWLVPLIIVGALAIAYYLHGIYRTTPFGRATVAVRDEEIGASAFGISSYLTKVSTFAMGSALGALGGGLFSYLSAYISPDAFKSHLSITLLVMVILGGPGSRIGPVVGTAILVVLPLSLAQYPMINQLIYGALLIILVRWRPRGLFSRTAATSPSITAAIDSLPDAPPVRADDAATDAERPVVLTATDVHRSFGGVKALRGVSLQVRQGEILGLIGPNGSGKTTMLNVISGMYPATSGTVELNGQVISGLSAARVARAGVSRTFQTPKTFPGMSISEHLAVAAAGHGDVDPARRRAFYESAVRTLELAGLSPEDGIRGPKESRGLAHGQLRFLEIASAVAQCPTLLMLDEPAAGLSQSEIEGLEKVVTEVASLGVAVIIVEHHLDMVSRLVDQVVVLDLGSKLWEGAPADLHEDKAVRTAYLGTV